MNASWVKMLDKNPKLARLPHSQRREVVDRRMCIVSFYSVARNCTHTLNLVLPCVEMAWRPGSCKAVFVTKAVENGYPFQCTLMYKGKFSTQLATSA